MNKKPHHRGRPSIWNEEKEKTFRKLWDQGLSTGAIAERFGCQRNVINVHARKLGFPKRDRRGLTLAAGMSV